MRLRWPRERDLEALTGLHVLQQGLAAPSSDLVGGLSELIDRFRAVPHAAFVYGPGLTEGSGGQRRALALHELVRALCHERHVVTLELPRAPGTRTADDVLAWQSGYGGTVDFASGHPELVTATEPLDEVDVTVVVESGAGWMRWPPGPGSRYGSVPPPPACRPAAQLTGSTGSRSRSRRHCPATRRPRPRC